MTSHYSRVSGEKVRMRVPAVEKGAYCAYNSNIVLKKDIWVTKQSNREDEV